MRRTLLALFLTCTFAAPLLAQQKPLTRAREEHCATCYGDTPCRACSTCRYCGHCAGGGGTCGVCKPEEKPKPNPPPKKKAPKKKTPKKG